MRRHNTVDKRCVTCGVDYEHTPGTGSSPIQCEACGSLTKNWPGMQSNIGHRPRGHKTRGIHKNILRYVRIKLLS